MAVIVRKRKGENIGSLIFRFGRKMKQSGVLKNVKKDAQILDYGCGLGHLLVYLHQMGFKNTFG